MGVAADPPETLATFARRRGVPYVLLSDPQLQTAEALDVPTMGKHPMSVTYPKRAFLQPALFAWLPDGRLVYQWRQTPALKNVFGAAGRPSPEQVLAIARGVLDGTVATP